MKVLRRVLPLTFGLDDNINMTWLRSIFLPAVLFGAFVSSSADAQPATRVFRIGTLGNENTPTWEGLRQGLRDLGYVEGRNITVEARWSDGSPDRLPALARELAALKPDVIVASSTQAIRAAKDATTTIPVVMVLASFPDKVGLIESLARPGGNVTGLSTLGPQLMAKRVELLREIIPKASRVAVLFDPANPVESLAMRELVTAAEASGVKVQAFAARTPEEVVTSLAAAASSGADALWAFGNPANFKGRQLIGDAAGKNRLPSMFDEGTFVDAGGLVSYGPSYYDQFRRAAAYVDKILKGAKPAELPVEQPIKFELSLNQKTARTLGLTIPPSVLLRANRVIE
jgi:putative ABC transport system substrate-binding protein